jgi:hypothetical protein
VRSDSVAATASSGDRVDVVRDARHPEHRDQLFAVNGIGEESDARQEAAFRSQFRR